MSKRVKTCQNVSKRVYMCQRVETCQNVSTHVKTCQNVSKHVKACQSMSKCVNTCQNVHMSKHVNTCQHVSTRVKTCQHMSTCVNTYQNVSKLHWLKRLTKKSSNWDFTESIFLPAFASQGVLNKDSTVWLDRARLPPLVPLVLPLPENEFYLGTNLILF